MQATFNTGTNRLQVTTLTRKHTALYWRAGLKLAAGVEGGRDLLYRSRPGQETCPHKTPGPTKLFPRMSRLAKRKSRPAGKKGPRVSHLGARLREAVEGDVALPAHVVHLVFGLGVAQHLSERERGIERGERGGGREGGRCVKSTRCRTGRPGSWPWGCPAPTWVGAHVQGGGKREWEGEGGESVPGNICHLSEAAPASTALMKGEV